MIPVLFLIAFLYSFVLNIFFSLFYFLEIYIAFNLRKEYAIVYIESYLLERKTSYLSESIRGTFREIYASTKKIYRAVFTFFFRKQIVLATTIFIF